MMNNNELYKISTIALTPDQVKEMYFKGTGKHTKVVMLEDVTMNMSLDQLFDTNNGFILYIPVMPPVYGF